jgi:hypothetical protein
VCVVLLVPSRALIACRSSIATHCGTLMRVGAILSCLCAILLGLRLVPRSVAAFDHDCAIAGVDAIKAANPSPYTVRIVTSFFSRSLCEADRTSCAGRHANMVATHPILVR